MILIAVALFAALSFAITQSTRTGGSSTSRETTDLEASKILQYAVSVDTTLQRMRMMTSKRDWQFDFSGNPNYVAVNPNTNCTDTSCRLFSENGGSIPSGPLGAKMLSTDFLTLFPGSLGPFIVFELAGVRNIGSSLPEVVLHIQGINLDICQALNRKLLNIDSVSADTMGAPGRFSGAMTDWPTPGGAVTDLGTGWTALVGQNAGCYTDGGWNFGNFYYVLLAR